MKILKGYKSILMGIVAVLVLFGGYTYFLKGSPDPEVLVGGTGAAADATLVPLLLEIQNIELDASILDDERYKSLEDFTQELRPVPSGRPNPFAPIGSSARIGDAVDPE